MKLKLFPILLLSFLPGFSCKKDNPVIASPHEYRVFTIVWKDKGDKGVTDSLIIELNNNFSLKSIKEFYLYAENFNYLESNQSFFYSAHSTKIDSSVIISTNRLYGTVDILTEQYLYEGNNIKKVFKQVISPVTDNETYEFSYNQNGQITNVIHIYHMRGDTINTNTVYSYLNKNLVSSTDGNSYSEYDQKVNPLNYIFIKTRYPVFMGRYNMFPDAYCFSENNPGKINSYLGITIIQTYKYNYLDYPVQVISNWQEYNIRYYYR
jgi:hypothetical protein